MPGGRTGPGAAGAAVGGARGIPDGLLLGLLGLLLGLAALTWTATGLSAWLAHGSWPDGLDFPRTPLAIRELVTDPKDLAAAWPGVPDGALSGYGLFWGLFIGQLMVLTVLAVFLIGTVTRWRAVRATHREDARVSRPGPDLRKHAPGPVPAPRAERPADTAEPPAATGTVPAPGTAPPAAASTGTAPPPGRGPSVHGLLVGAGRDEAAEAVRDAEGALLVVTADPGLWAEAAGARAKLGPVHVYDPEQFTDAPTRLRWAPHHGCEDMTEARSRAAALLAPVRSPARSDAAVHDAAETLLRCWLHAAALDREPFRQVHRWSLTGSSRDALRILRTNPAGASGASGELEAGLTAYPERREEATKLIRRALNCVSQLHVRNASTPPRIDRLAWESFVSEGGSLFVVGESLEDPHRGDPAAMPLLTALTSAVVGHGRRMAARSSAGRLDPPVTLVLDHPATVAPLPELPWLLSDGAPAGLVTRALVRSEEQLRTWWPELAPHRP
ncbi:type VI secretion protein [Streptomyces sp. RKND-216]|uniref:type VI secretion protein n=1 Tax=Streptomyces sp. RKND-216 TaxID=2562581 RepID=UPI00109DFF96|nr:type VI secretion protein [Streptomyces sp. RKND-216]THA27722.1 type VI secretion protein [Streptomyces sp. RKND-216]